MKAVFLLAGLLWVASIQAITCQRIDDADQRAYCRAMQSGSLGQCAAIINFDLPKRNRPAISDNASLCNQITDGWYHEQSSAHSAVSVSKLSNVYLTISGLCTYTVTSRDATTNI